MKNTKMKDDIKSHLKTILLICSSFASTSIFAEIKGISFSHGDWELACDNTSRSSGGSAAGASRIPRDTRQG